MEDLHARPSTHKGRIMHLRGFGIVALVVILCLLGAASASAAERLVYEAFPAPESEVEETGNLYVMEEGEEPEPLEMWGRNPSLDSRSRLIAFYENGEIYVTDFKGRVTREVLYVGKEAAASPQWVPGRGIVTDGGGDIYVMDYTKEFPFLEMDEVNWPGKQWAPAASPDGEKIAFLSETNPEGEALEGGPAIFTTNVDGSNPVQITNPAIAVPVGAPTFSPDGSHIAFSAFGEFNEWEEGDLVSMLMGTEGVSQITSIPEGIAWEPDWLPSGHIVFTEEHWSSGDMELLGVSGVGGETQQLHAPFTNGEFAYHIAGRQPFNWEPMTSESNDRATQLLHLYAPTLKYDSTEVYRAAAVNSIFETYSGTKPEDSNRLVNSEGKVIQYANPKLNALELRIWLAAQGKEYFTDPVLADESDRLDERNESYAEDAAPWQEDPYYGDISYGRPIYAEGHWWLQYWLWYYYDDFNLFGVGNHEGDWEMIQIQLDENGNPQLATYSQHGNSEADTCNFDVLDWTVGQVPNVSPVAYVGTGTHASFIRPGIIIGSPPYDRADGEGYVARTKMVEMLKVWGSGSIGGSYAREWPLWPGRWGSSLGVGESPMAPISQEEKWDHPGEFAEQAESCPEEEEGTPQARVQSAMSRRPTPPRAPLIRARLKDHAVIVHYKLKDAPVDRKQGVEVAILASKALVTPVKRTAWMKNGSLRLPLPDGDGPYTVVARSLSQNGAGSPSAKIELGGWNPRHQHSRAHARRSVASSVDGGGGGAIFAARFVRRVGVVAARALRRKERHMRAATVGLRNAPAPVVVRALGDKEVTGGR